MIVTPNDHVVSAVSEWVNCMYAGILVLSQFGQQFITLSLLVMAGAEQFPRWPSSGMCLWELFLEVQPRLCFFHLSKDSISYLINVINIFLLEDKSGCILRHVVC